MDPEVKALLERWEQEGITPESILGIEEKGMQTDEEPLLGPKHDGRPPKWWFALIWVVLIPAALIGVLWNITDKSARKSDVIATQEVWIEVQEKWGRSGWDTADDFATEVTSLEEQLVAAESDVDLLAGKQAELLMTLNAPTSVPEPTPTSMYDYDGPDAWAIEIKPPLYPVNFNDDIQENGYCHGIYPEGRYFCPPGYITYESAFYSSPIQFYGSMSSYAEGTMERMCDRNGPCDGYKGGVAIVSCAAIGKTVWLRVPPGSWKGPFLVVDCGAIEHQYFHHAVINLAVEVGYKIAQSWRPHSPYVEVHIGGSPPSSFDGTSIGWWWVANILEWRELEE